MSEWCCVWLGERMWCVSHLCVFEAAHVSGYFSFRPHRILFKRWKTWFLTIVCWISGMWSNTVTRNSDETVFNREGRNPQIARAKRHTDVIFRCDMLVSVFVNESWKFTHLWLCVCLRDQCGKKWRTSWRPGQLHALEAHGNLSILVFFALCACVYEEYLHSLTWPLHCGQTLVKHPLPPPLPVHPLMDIHRTARAFPKCPVNTNLRFCGLGGHLFLFFVFFSLHKD